MCIKEYVRINDRSLWKKQNQEDDRRQFKKEKKKEGGKEEEQSQEMSFLALVTWPRRKQISEKEIGRRADFVVQVKPSVCQNIHENERSVSQPSW